MKTHLRVVVWLQLFTACVVLGVDGELSLCVCLQFQPPPLTSPDRCCSGGVRSVNGCKVELFSTLLTGNVVRIIYLFLCLVFDGLFSAWRHELAS